MKIIKMSELAWVAASAIFCSTFVYFQATDLVESNKWKGYHCTPITKHIGIESAKKQVSAYQAMVRG